ncbi:MAG: hypothetical protein ACXQS2_06120 [Methermicoccaceae archaeon]
MWPFSLLSGSKKTIEAGADIAKTITGGVVGGIDALFYTDEEKAQAALEGRKVILKYWDTFAKENSEQSKARRELAKMTFQVYFFLLLLCVAVWPLNREYGVFVFNLAVKITWLVGMIAATYFVPHQMSKVWKSKNAE